MKNVGIIGCGAIGTLIAEAVEKRIVECEALILYDYTFEKAERLKKLLHVRTTLVESVDEMIKLKPAVIVEAASQQAVKAYLPKIMAADIDMIVMSVGALLSMNVKNNRIHVPSGAIGGLDAISSASLAGIDEVVLTTRKNPKTLGMDNREEQLVYEGSAEEAAELFPKIMNVAATLALAVKPEVVKARVVSDPTVDENVHEIKVQWKHGDMTFRFSNEPHPQNPKTSALAAWSAIALLKEILKKQV